MGRAGELGAALVDLALPVVCACCGRPGHHVCDRCRRDAWGWCHAGGPQLVVPDPSPPGLPPVLAAAVNDGAVRRLLHAYKDEGRRDVRSCLRDLLVPVVQVAARHVVPLDAGASSSAPTPLVLVPVPTTPAACRQRGDRPLEDLVRAASRQVPGTTTSRLLRSRGTRVDQALLGARARAANLAGTMAARPSALQAVGGLPVVVVDDLLTTGATLVEATRALGEAGVPVVACLVVAATARRPAPRPALRSPVRGAIRPGTGLSGGLLGKR